MENCPHRCPLLPAAATAAATAAALAAALTAAPAVSLIAALAIALLLPGEVSAIDGEKILEAPMHHLRAGGEREWEEFPETAEGRVLKVPFNAEAGGPPFCIRVRQRDVRQTWTVQLNGKEIGRLVEDENELWSLFEAPAGAVRSGENILEVAATGTAVDDILVGDIRLREGSRENTLSEASVEIRVSDASGGAPLPCRLTITDPQGALVPLGSRSGENLAIRTGMVCAKEGRAVIRLPAGDYIFYAGRGFEYSIASRPAALSAGSQALLFLTLKREVPVPGYAACDTHIHTLTHSGHGDATVEERLIAIAAEGIELAVATDHNRHVSYEKEQSRLGLLHRFTSICGNEVTTARGHFNLFPAPPEAAPAPFEAANWKTLFAGMRRTPGVEVIILNHARDIFQGYRPFGEEHHLALAGENLDGEAFEADALEIANSSAQQADPTLLFHDWLGLLNHGLAPAPIGSSDSHDVGRYLVGQGRTYIRCRDGDPGRIDAREACASLKAGRVLVSMGLLTEITVNGSAGPGDTARWGASTGGSMVVRLRVLGPGWTSADSLALYANGQKIRETAIQSPPDPRAPGSSQVVKWEGEWTFPRPRRDVVLAAIATGPGTTVPCWRIPRPYARTSPRFTPRLLGTTGAVFVDADGDGTFTSALDYARGLVEKAGGDLDALLRSLEPFDVSAAVQAAGLLRAAPGGWPPEAEIEKALSVAPDAARQGFNAYRDAWQKCLEARNRRNSGTQSTGS